MTKRARERERVRKKIGNVGGEGKERRTHNKDSKMLEIRIEIKFDIK